MAKKVRGASLGPDVFPATVNRGRTTGHDYLTGQLIFAQGDVADSVFYVARGNIKIFVNSEQGREAVVALLYRGGLFWRRVPDCATVAPGDGRFHDRRDGVAP